MPRDARQPTTKRVWRAADGTPVSCYEKLKVLEENLDEIREMAQEALEDAVLMGCDEAQAREVMRELIEQLEEPFKN